MQIANPIYDAVFKFMMEDKKVAMLLIGAITEFEIEDVELRPTEVVTDEVGARQWTVYRLDLAVRVRTSEGARLVLVEIQKAKLYTDIMRFRRYLGDQYASSENYEKVWDDQGRERLRALPIFSIYILGHRLQHNSDIPVIQVKRSYTDRTTGEPLLERDDFIESLTHDSAIIQIPALKERRRDRLEKMLAIFDQAQISKDNRQLLNIDDETYPEECRVVLRRLARAVSNQKIRQKMIVEDEIVAELEMRNRREQDLFEQVLEERRQKEEERRLKEAVLAENAELKRLLETFRK